MKQMEKEICSICGKELSKEEINEFDGYFFSIHPFISLITNLGIKKDA